MDAATPPLSGERLQCLAIRAESGEVAHHRHHQTRESEEKGACHTEGVGEDRQSSGYGKAAAAVAAGGNQIGNPADVRGEHEDVGVRMLGFGAQLDREPHGLQPDEIPTRTDAGEAVSRPRARLDREAALPLRRLSPRHSGVPQRVLGRRHRQPCPLPPAAPYRSRAPAAGGR